MKSVGTAHLLTAGIKEHADGEKYHDLCFYFQLHTEDMDLAHLVLQWVNEKHLCPEMDMADFMLSCITHEIHRMTEEMTGKPFVLRMDRKEKKA